jgi:hypothetical protein
MAGFDKVDPAHPHISCSAAPRACVGIPAPDGRMGLSNHI